MKPEHILTHIDIPEDKVYLRTRAFPVNMRLFKHNQDYCNIIHQCIGLIRKTALSEFDFYKKPHGTSGANLAIPFNIIGIVKNRGEAKEYVQIMINPSILGYRGKMVESKSNCGSIRLEVPITINRYEVVDVTWFDEEGIERAATFTKDNGGFTIQHEIDHNNGVLITDRQGKHNRFNTVNII